MGQVSWRRDASEVVHHRQNQNEATNDQEQPEHVACPTTHLYSKESAPVMPATFFVAINGTIAEPSSALSSSPIPLCFLQIQRHEVIKAAIVEMVLERATSIRFLCTINILKTSSRQTLHPAVGPEHPIFPGSLSASPYPPLSAISVD